MSFGTMEYYKLSRNEMLSQLHIEVRVVRSSSSRDECAL